MKKVMLTAFVVGLCTTAKIIAQVPSYVPTNGLVGWWPFNGNANDESVIGNNGTVNGATLTTDRFGNNNSAFEFNGSTSIINCSNPSIPQNSSFSISFWINPSSVSGVQEFFHQNVWPGAFYVGMNGGIMRCGDSWQNTGVSVNTSQWQHFIIVRNYMNNVEIYLNGTLQTSLGSDITLGGNTTDPLVFGKQYGSNTEFYNGILDDIGIWNRTITQQEITDLYNGTLGINQLAENSISIYPNPTNDHITIDAGNLSVMNGFSFKIQNTQGQQVFQNAINQKQFNVDITKLGGNGLYFVHLIDPQNNTVTVRKIVLK